MSLKNVKLIKGLANGEVNKLTSPFGVQLLDEVYLGTDFKHKWKCECGREYTRTWKLIRGRESKFCLGIHCYQDILNQKGNDIHTIRLWQNSSREDVNYILDGKLELVDDIYNNDSYKHNWICMKCGKTFKRDWQNIKAKTAITCRACRYPKNTSITVEPTEENILKMKHSKIKGFENYTVYEDGSIYSHITNKFLVQTKVKMQKLEYLYVKLYDLNGKSVNKAVHRIVAENLIPNNNPENNNVVNHIDANTFNNHISNLEWCDTQHNVAWSIILGNKKLNKNSKVIGKYNEHGELITVFSSIRALSRMEGISRDVFRTALKNKRQIKGFRYKEIGKFCEITDEHILKTLNDNKEDLQFNDEGRYVAKDKYKRKYSNKRRIDDDRD